jgi:hypothetical protein
MKPRHPFALLAPYFALVTFGVTALLGWLRQSDAMAIAGHSIVAFFLAFYCVRLGASVLVALFPRAGDAAADKVGHPSGSEQS